MRIAIDTGGTFTDCVYEGEQGVGILKIPSTPADPGEALIEAVRSLGDGITEVRHGTTVGTNALLERKGARVAFVTTSGFEDTIAIGRQARTKLYDLSWAKEADLAPSELRFGVTERIASDGSVLRSVRDEELALLTKRLLAARPEAIALSLLFSFVNPANEEAAAKALRKLGLPVSVAHEILPEFREYERGSTVLINAYLTPRMQRYIERIDAVLQSQGARLQVMQSSGGIISAALAAREPVRTILSGPAGGVVGATTVARNAGYKRILSFDMGGTSTDVALVDIEAGLATTRESIVLGMPVAVPMLNIHTVGAGGGSIARFDPGGALRVGPESAGAEPGPICCGRGALPTVTDANLLLGRLEADAFLAGGMQLDAKRAWGRFAELKGALETVEQFAEGIVRVVDSHMEKALRRISVEQGHDPREFLLVSFGGAGPLHAVALARALRISQVMIPMLPGALSAYGILVSDIIRDYSRTIMLRPNDDAIERHFGEMEETARREMAVEGIHGAAVRSLHVRYAGQGYELAVAWSNEFTEQFHQLHKKRYGYADRGRQLEVVNARVRIVARSNTLEINPSKRTSGSAEQAFVKQRPIYCDGEWREGKVYDRSRLASGARVEGPAVIVEYSATTFVPPLAGAHVDAESNLIVEVNP